MYHKFSNVREWNIREPYIGQRFNCAGIEGRIIGVVKDFHHKSLHEKIGPLVFVNMWHNMIVFKTQAGQSAQAIQAAKKIWTDFFPNDPFEFAFLDDTFNNLYRDDIKTSQLIFLFSILAIVIALSGLFGLATFAVERRTKEIGLRKVFGASSSSIVHLLTREFIVLVAVAVAIAAPVSWWAMNRWLENFAYRIHIGWQIFALAGIITLALTLITIGWQAIRAATANPVKSIMNGD